MWVPGNAPASLASASSSTAPAGAATTTTGISSGGATAAAVPGKSIFDSHGCAGCHGEGGGGGSGPALTHVSGQYPPDKLTALLKAPTAKMKAAGMVALTVNAADMKALVSYMTSLGGTSAGATATPPASASSSTRAGESGTRGDSRSVESPSQRPDRRYNLDRREKHFRFPRLRWMPRRERRWRLRASVDSCFQSISAS